MFCTSSSSSDWDLRYFSCISWMSQERQHPYLWVTKRDTYLVLLLPLITLLFETCNLPLKMFRLYVHLPQPTEYLRVS